ncbi:MAG: hypothetical protein R3C49_14335 [Planctomycetaceae bacterium]
MKPSTPLVLLFSLTAIAHPVVAQESRPPVFGSTLQSSSPFDDRLPAPPDNAVPTIGGVAIETPEGKPAAGAVVRLDTGHLLDAIIPSDSKEHVRIVARDIVDPNSESTEALTSDAEGWVEFPDIKGARVLVVHAAGYAIENITPNSRAPICLKPWGDASGRVTVNGKPATGRLVARWESFPHHPAVLQAITNHPEDRSKAPPLISISQQVELQEDGHYQFNRIPPGRLHLTLDSFDNGRRPNVLEFCWLADCSFAA